ncbi:MAG: alkaline phosphatase family protein [Defluviitaleaceae bacterium]|nr:alkaline phosphatase family protein [Defluviitaleaceae bacterium]
MNKFGKFLLPLIILILAACGNGTGAEDGAYESSDEATQIYVPEATVIHAIDEDCRAQDFAPPAQVGLVQGETTVFLEQGYGWSMAGGELDWHIQPQREIAVFQACGMIHRLDYFPNALIPSYHGGGFAFLDDSGNFFRNIAGIIADPPDIAVTQAFHDALHYLQTGERVMVIVLDGWGWHMHAYFAHLQPFLASQYHRKAHTVFPPFTPVAMSSIFTGELPNVHGVHDRATRTMSAPDVFEAAAQLGFTSTRVQGGVNIVATSERPVLIPNLGHVFYTDRGVFDAAMTRIDDADFMFIHFNSIDDIAHTYGPYAPQVGEAMALTDEFVQELVAARGGVTIILGDHGQHFLGEPGRLGDHLWVSHEDIFIPYVVIGGR